MVSVWNARQEPSNYSFSSILYFRGLLLFFDYFCWIVTEVYRERQNHDVHNFLLTKGTVGHAEQYYSPMRFAWFVTTRCFEVCSSSPERAKSYTDESPFESLMDLIRG